MNRPTIIILLAAFLAALSSCERVTPVSIAQKEQYDRDFLKEFGLFDSDIEWNGANRISLVLSADLVSDAERVNVYSAMPGTPGAVHVAKFNAGVSRYEFDYPGHHEDVYIEIVDRYDRVITRGYHDIKDGVIEVAPSGMPSRSEVCGVMKGTEIADSIKYHYTVSMLDQYAHIGTSSAFWRDTIGAHDNTVVSRLSKAFHLDGKGDTEYRQVVHKLSDLLPMVGHTHGVYSEQQCNLTKFSSVLHPELGVSLTTASETEISLDYFYGATVKNENALGYIYYRRGATEEETWRNIVNAERYILIDDAGPRANLLWDGTPLTDGMALSTGIMRLENGWGTDHDISASRHRLVYFDGDVPSYRFPADMNVVFFISMDADFFMPYFSLPAINQKYGLQNYRCHIGSHRHDSEVSNVFSTFRWGRNLVMGVEDLGDHDMNDMMFFVDGDFKETQDIPQINPDNPTRQSWIIAAEDIGQTRDFDFNDVVFGVSHVAGENHATVTALAAGGTLPVYIHSSFPQIEDGIVRPTDNHQLIPQGSADGKIHSWFGAGTTDKVINVHEWTGPGATVTVQVPEDFSLAGANDPGHPSDSNMGGFWISVMTSDGATTTIGPPVIGPGHDAPQMFLVPSSWHWPREGTIITRVYDGFIKWTPRWWLYPLSGDFVRHDWK